jgi:hypothetical protein
MSALTVAPEIEPRPVLRLVEVPVQWLPEELRIAEQAAQVRVPEEGRQGPSRRVRTEPRPQAAAGPVRLTRRGRVILTLVFLGVALGLMVTFGGWATATLTGGTPDPVRVVEVQPGQTLYDIAGSVARPGHVREMVYKIEELNSLPSATIESGQKLAIPQG